MSLEHAEQELERLQQEERRAQDGADQAELRDRALQQADVVETEKKLYEDLEFKYLEEESVWLARREELSKELADAVRKHEETVARLQELEAAAQVAELEGSMEGYEEQRQAYLQRLHEGQAQLDMLDGRVDELVGQGAANLTGASSTSLNDLDSNSSDPFSNSGLTSMESSFCSYIEVKPRAAEDGKECAYSGGVGGNNVDKSRCPGDVPPGSRSPPSGASDMSLVAARPVGNRQQRPLTRYLPIRAADLDLRQHIESAGHAVELCRHVQVDGHSCRGELRKASARFGNWQKRWFVFDRSSRTLAYYKSKRDTRVRGGIHFQ
ncbi:Pleckstrin homology-like domain family B member 2, partial [Frankliniella fusca]